jgi:hypothetical protein
MEKKKKKGGCGVVCERERERERGEPKSNFIGFSQKRPIV